MNKGKKEAIIFREIKLTPNLNLYEYFLRNEKIKLDLVDSNSECLIEILQLFKINFFDYF